MGKIFLATFVAVFVAELADKTQLVGITMSAKSGRPLTVWLGSVAAYILVTGLSVFLGAWLTRFVKPDVLRLTAAACFIIMGLIMLFNRI